VGKRIIPPGMTFEHALRLGYAGKIECRPYLDWLKTLPCDTCGAPPPSDPSHLDNAFKGMGTKAPDIWAIPECRTCHELYEQRRVIEHGARIRLNVKDESVVRLSRAAIYLAQGFYVGRLKWIS